MCCNEIFINAKRVSEARLPTPFGLFTAIVYCSLLDGVEHLVLVQGEVEGQSHILVRVHSECLTGDVFDSLRCDCGSQLKEALRRISEEKKGVLIYLRGQEGRGIGIRHKLQAYALQDQGLDTVEANEHLGLPIDAREYSIAAHILCDLGLSTIRLLTNNPAKYHGLEEYGLSIVEKIPIIPAVTPENLHYLQTKQEKLGHELGLPSLRKKLAT